MLRVITKKSALLIGDTREHLATLIESNIPAIIPIYGLIIVDKHGVRRLASRAEIRRFLKEIVIKLRAGVTKVKYCDGNKFHYP